LRYIIGVPATIALIGGQAVMTVIVFAEGSPAGGALAILAAFWMVQAGLAGRRARVAGKEVPRGY